MQITVKLYATLRQYGSSVSPAAGLILDVPTGSDVAGVVEHVGIPDGVALVAMVNNEVVHLDHAVVAGDVVSLFPPVAGG